MVAWTRHRPGGSRIEVSDTVAPRPPHPWLKPVENNVAFTYQVPYPNYYLLTVEQCHVLAITAVVDGSCAYNFCIGLQDRVRTTIIVFCLHDDVNLAVLYWWTLDAVKYRLACSMQHAGKAWLRMLEIGSARLSDAYSYGRWQRLSYNRGESASPQRLLRGVKLASPRAVE